MSKTFLFQAILFCQTLLIKTNLFNVSTVSMSKNIIFKQFRLALKKQFHFKTIQFNISTQLTLVDLGAMAINEYSAFQKDPALLEPHHQIV